MMRGVRQLHNARRPTGRAVIGAAAVWLCVILINSPWRSLDVINSDAYGYDHYLVSALSPNGMGSAQTFLDLEQTYPQVADFRGHGANPLPNGDVAFKYTMGTAVMHAPLFLAAHVFTLWTGGAADGYSAPYQAAIALSNWGWSVMALLVTTMLLRRWFSEQVSAAVILLLAFGTNTFYYAALTFGMTHMPSMFLVGATMVAVLSWLDRPRRSAAAWVGAGLGLIGLVRPTDLVFVVIPMAAWFRHLATQPAGQRRYADVAIAAATALLVFAPQLLYWRLITGSWWYFGYGGVGLNPFDSHLVEGIFGFQKGWLVYTPAMWLALPGFVLLMDKSRWLGRAVVVFVAAHAYVVFAWPEWWYGAGFGARSMIQSYAVLALPVASCVQRLSMRWVVSPLIVLVVTLNLFQTWQTTRGILHATFMHRAAYVETFGALQLSEAEQSRLYPEDSHALIEAQASRDADRVPDNLTTVLVLAGLGLVALAVLGAWTWFDRAGS